MKGLAVRQSRFSSLWLAASLAAILGFRLPALAALGGGMTSIEADRAQMNASGIQVTQATTYDVQEIHTPGGTVVKEFLSRAGKVFAVSWQGPFLPEMQQILGDYFQQYSAALQAQEKHYGHRPLNIQQPGLVVETSGHMRAYFGRAYVPEMVPEGVRAVEIK